MSKLLTTEKSHIIHTNFYKAIKIIYDVTNHEKTSIK